MIRRYLILFYVCCAFNLQAQDKKVSYEIDTILTSAECDNCKERIEQMLNYTKGIKFAELDVSTKKLVVKYHSGKLTLSEIKHKLSDLGYDADEVKANQVAQKKLPLCCQPGGMNENK